MSRSDRRVLRRAATPITATIAWSAGPRSTPRRRRGHAALLPNGRGTSPPGRAVSLGHSRTRRVGGHHRHHRPESPGAGLPRQSGRPPGEWPRSCVRQRASRRPPGGRALRGGIPALWLRVEPAGAGAARGGVRVAGSGAVSRGVAAGGGVALGGGILAPWLARAGPRRPTRGRALAEGFGCWCGLEADRPYGLGSAAGGSSGTGGWWSALRLPARPLFGGPWPPPPARCSRPRGPPPPAPVAQ